MQSKSERRETAVDQRLVAPSISYRKAIILLAAATFFYWSALYFYLPILPVYAQSLGASLSGVGIVVATYALPQLLLRIPMGMWADTTGKRKYLLASGVAMVVIGAVGLGLAPNPLVLGIARTATGIGASVWTIFTVYFASFYSQGNPRRAIGVISFVMGAAMVAATVGGGFTASARGPEFAFFLAAALGIVSLFFVLPTREPITARQTEATSWHSLISVAKEPLLLSASVMGMLLCFVNFSSVLGFTPVYAARIGASSRELGIITMVAQAALAVGSLIAIYIAEQYGNRVTVIIGAILLAIGLLAVPFIKSVYVLEATQLLNGLGTGILGTILMALSIQAISPRERTTAMGVYQAAYSIGMLVGPLASGFLADSCGLPAVFYLSASVSLVIAAIALLPALCKQDIARG